MPLQLLGKAIPYTDAARANRFEEEEGDAEERGSVDCNVIMMGYGRQRGRLTETFSKREWESFGGVGEEEGGRGGGGGSGSCGSGDGEVGGWLSGGGEGADGGLAALRCALQGSRSKQGHAVSDVVVVDDGDCDGVVELEADDELVGVGIEELTRRMNALHAAQQQQQQQHAPSGVSVLSYLDTMRRHG
jgi:hypothetical protein